MEDLIAGIPFQSIGLASLVTLAILAIIRGDLVPRKQHEEVVADRDDWRRIALNALDSLAKLTPAAETTAAVLDALPRPTREEPKP